MKNVPEQSVDGDLNLFSDLGAWSGYALPVNQSRAFAGAFIGPMTMHGRGWIAQTLAQPTLVVNGEKYDLVRWGIVEETLKAHNKPFVENYVGTKHQLFPIPHSEFLLNPDWEQNPNYSK